MIENKLVWIRCQDLQTELRVKEVLEEAREKGMFPADIHCLLSYGEEIEMGSAEEFLSQLENMVAELKIIVSNIEKVAT